MYGYVIVTHRSIVSTKIEKPALSRPLQYVESSASTSGDEICPHNPQQHPVRKPYGDKKKFSDWYDLREYSIEQLSEYDDDGIVKPWHRTLIMIQPIVVAWVFITYAVCYSYRIWCNYQFRLQYGGLADASWTLVVVEGICICEHDLHLTLSHAYSANSSAHELDDCPVTINRQS